MANQNKCFFTGRLGRDPEQRFTQSGDAVCNFSIAVSEKFKDKSGELQERTDWINCVAWRKLAEICAKYLAKGSFVRVEGRYQTRPWEDKDGNKRTTVEIVLTEMEMLSSRSADSGSEESGQAPDDEDIPF